MIMVSEPDKLILESIAKAKGISVEEVKKDLKKNKKPKARKKRKATDPTVELISSDNAKTVEFSQVKGVLRRQTARENVFEWNIKDVSFYIREKFQKKYDKDWGHRTIGVCPELMRIHDRILDIYGHCDFHVMRDYIDYIFEEKIDGIIDKSKGVFYLNSLREDRHIASFSEVYDYKESFEREKFGGKKKTEKNEKSPSISTTNASISEVFRLSEDSFVKTYGIVICIFWLIKCQHYTNQQAAIRILDICKRIHKKGEFKEVKEATESFSPYHDSINFPKMEVFLKNIDGRYKIEIEYKENDIIKSKFKFLTEEQG
jgi:hypothetical protein